MDPNFAYVELLPHQKKHQELLTFQFAAGRQHIDSKQ